MNNFDVVDGLSAQLALPVLIVLAKRVVKAGEGERPVPLRVVVSPRTEEPHFVLWPPPVASKVGVTLLTTWSLGYGVSARHASFVRDVASQPHPRNPSNSSSMNCGNPSPSQARAACPRKVSK